MGAGSTAKYVFNIVDWEGGELPPLYERSAQLPMSLKDVVELTKAEFGARRHYAGPSIVECIE